MLPDESRPRKFAGLSAAFWQAAVRECNTTIDCVWGGHLPDWRAAFDMARAVRGVVDSDKVHPLTVAREVYRLSALVSEFFPCEEDFLQQFSAAWQRVRIIPGEDLLSAAVRQADQAPLLLRKELVETTPAGFKRFISFCAYLCVSLDSTLIKVPCREVAQALGVQRNTVSSYRQDAEKYGYLTQVRPHRYQPSGKGEATLFRFALELWPDTHKRLSKPAAA